MEYIYTPLYVLGVGYVNLGKRVRELSSAKNFPRDIEIKRKKCIILAYLLTNNHKFFFST